MINDYFVQRSHARHLGKQEGLRHDLLPHVACKQIGEVCETSFYIFIRINEERTCVDEQCAYDRKRIRTFLRWAWQFELSTEERDRRDSTNMSKIIKKENVSHFGWLGEKE